MSRSYFDKELNKILNENIDLLVVGFADLLTSLGFEHLLKRFDCDDAKSFQDLEKKILDLKVQRKYNQVHKLELFLKKKRAECFNSLR
jgi:hypothetical protein